MRPPDKISPAPRVGGNRAEEHRKTVSCSEHNSAPRISQVRLDRQRVVDDYELLELRRMWWRQRRHGYTLPPESGVIQLDGGAL